eukprot:14196454-Alexandrium_andersonii.AAC.1
MTSCPRTAEGAGGLHCQHSVLPLLARCAPTLRSLVRSLRDGDSSGAARFARFGIHSIGRLY